MNTSHYNYIIPLIICQVSYCHNLPTYKIIMRKRDCENYDKKLKELHNLEYYSFKPKKFIQFSFTATVEGLLLYLKS